ncbi:flippase [Soonwooa sp.]|uniref:flippase n=1 Tax=Soonwooa sp. TaxID=1938592 RepID=UPI0028A82365|nr:flippase [Soonwooa sp.]
MNIFLYFKNKIINDKKVVFTNFLYISLVNFTNLALPFVTFPYLVKVLGVDGFGLLAFATSIMSYFLLLTDYGFNLTATKQIALYRDSPENIEIIFNSVFIIKLILCFVSLLILLILIMVLPKFATHSLIYIYSFGMVIGQTLFSIWFFQGIERMRFISILNVIAKIFFTIMVFFFVKKPSDIYLVPAFNSLGYISIGLISLLVVIFRYNVSLKWQSISSLKFYLNEGKHIFFSNISVSLYTSAVTTILGFLTNNTIVGYYNIAEKIIQLVRACISPITQAMYPYLIKKSVENKDDVLAINFKFFKLGCIPFLLVSIGLYIFAPHIIGLITNSQNEASISVLRIFSPLPFIIFLATIFGLFTMLVFNRYKAYSKIIFSAGIINLVLCFIFIPNYSYKGAAVSVLLVEVFVTTCYIVYTRRNNLKLF